MKAFILLLISVLSMNAAGIHPLRNPAWLKTSGGSGGGPPVHTWLLNETLEGPGYLYAWTTNVSAGASLNQVYTGVVLAGSYSLNMDAPSSDVCAATNTFAGQSTVYGYTLLRFVAFPSSGIFFIHMKDSSGNNLLTCEFTASQQMRIRCGSATVACVDAFSTGVTYHFWWRYTKGTGANAVASFGFSTDGTKPTSGNKFCSLSTGTSTADTDRIVIGTPSARTQQFIWDNIRVDDEVIGDNGL